MGVPGAIARFPKLVPPMGLSTSEDRHGSANLVFLDLHGLAEKAQFFGDLRQPLRTLGLILGDDWVTIGVRIKPWGSM